MNPMLVALQIIIALILIGAILLQPGAKGGGLGSAFGGGGANSAFGARGAAPFLAKATYWLGGAFLAICLMIEVSVILKNRSVLGRRPVTAPSSTIPANPAPTPASPSPTPAP